MRGWQHSRPVRGAPLPPPPAAFSSSLEPQDRRAVVVDVDVAHVPLERLAAGVHVEVPVHHLLHPLEGLEVLVYSRAELELVLQAVIEIVVCGHERGREREREREQTREKSVRILSAEDERYLHVRELGY